MTEPLLSSRTGPGLAPVIGAWLVACSAAPSPQAAAPAGGARPPEPQPSAAAAPDVPSPPEQRSTATDGPAACGDLDCRLYGSPQAAFRAILASEPEISVLAVGESHTLRGSEHIESVAQRFGKDLLPLLRGRATDLVIELLTPDPRCKKETRREVEREQEVVTREQAPTAQNDFIELGHRAKALGIQPHALAPSCEDLERIAAAGEEAVLEMLTTITRLTDETVRSLFDRRSGAGGRPLVIAYGGAMHNDLVPREGRERWSFGPSLSEYTGGAYVAVDLIVPELVGDTPAWRALPWYSAYDPDAHPDRAIVFKPQARSYVLIFPRGG